MCLAYLNIGDVDVPARDWGACKNVSSSGGELFQTSLLVLIAGCVYRTGIFKKHC